MGPIIILLCALNFIKYCRVEIRTSTYVILDCEIQYNKTNILSKAFDSANYDFISFKLKNCTSSIDGWLLKFKMICLHDR